MLILLNVLGWAAAEPWWLQVVGEPDDPAGGRRVLRGGVTALIAAAHVDPQRAEAITVRRQTTRIIAQQLFNSRRVRIGSVE